jgi:hypothetical protein
VEPANGSTGVPGATFPTTGRRYQGGLTRPNTANAAKGKGSPGGLPFERRSLRADGPETDYSAGVPAPGPGSTWTTPVAVPNLSWYG